MRLSDVMGHAGLAGYAEIALIIFFAVFLAIAVRTFLPSRQREMDEASRLPLEDERPSSPRPGANA